MVVQNLNEAYASIYAPREILEEAQIAAHYFDSIGLNEEGLQIVIEQLGVEEFTNFVYDIAESYYLSEEEYKQGTLNVLTKKGTGRKRPKVGEPEDIRHTPSRREETSESPNRTSEGQLKIDFSRRNRDDAVKNAKRNKPKRGEGGIVDKLLTITSKAIDRHNTATKKWAPVGKGLLTAGGKIAGGLATAARAAVSEDFEAWVNVLVNEGYDLSEYTWDEMAEIYMEEVENLNERRYGIDDVLPSGRTVRSNMERQRGRHGANYLLRQRETKNRNDQAATSHFSRATTMDLVKNALDAGEEPSETPQFRNTIAARRRPRSAGEVPNERPGGLRAKATKAGGYRTLVRREEYDVYDYILEHLISEGYADDVDSALVMMSNMSEEWRESIVEAASHTIMSVRRPDKEVPGFFKKVYDRSPKLTRITDTLAGLEQSKKEEKESKQRRLNAGRLTVATKRGIEAATNRSDRTTGFASGSSLRPHERDDPRTNRNARRRRESGR